MKQQNRASLTQNLPSQILIVGESREGSSRRGTLSISHTLSPSLSVPHTLSPSPRQEFHGVLRLCLVNGNASCSGPFVHEGSDLHSSNVTLSPSLSTHSLLDVLIRIQWMSLRNVMLGKLKQTPPLPQPLTNEHRTWASLTISSSTLGFS